MNWTLAAGVWGAVEKIEAPNPWWSILRFLVGIIAVFLLLWFVARKFRDSTLGDYSGPGLRIMSRIPLTRTSQAVLVEIGGRMFLLGAAENSVTPIAEIYETDEFLAAAQAATEQGAARANAGARGGAGSKKSGSFADTLGAVLRRGDKSSASPGVKARPTPAPPGRGGTGGAAGTVGAGGKVINGSVLADSTLEPVVRVPVPSPASPAGKPAGRSSVQLVSSTQIADLAAELDGQAQTRSGAKQPTRAGGGKTDSGKELP